MTQHTGMKKPTGGSNHPAGHTDNTMLARTSRILKAVIIYAVIAAPIASCIDTVRSNAVNCEVQHCDL